MRVLHLITSLSTGGAETMLRNVVTRSKAPGNESLVVSLTAKSMIGEEIESNGIRVVALDGRAGVLTPNQCLQMFRTVRSWRPDIVHSWMYHANLAAQVMSSLIGRRRFRLITSVRGAMYAPQAQKRSLRVVRALDAKLSSRANAIVFNSRVVMRQHGGAGYDLRHACVIPNGFDTVKFRPSSAVRTRVRAELGMTNAQVVGIVARYHPLKGHRYFLEAAREISIANPTARFLMIGRGCDEQNSELTSLISSLGLKDKLISLGERHDVDVLQNAFDVAVCSSISESFPNSIGEAMAAGIPCVCSNVGDCSELVGTAGRIVPTGDSSAIAAAVLELLLLSAEQRAAIGAAGRQRIQANYSIDSVIQQFSSLHARVYEGLPTTDAAIQ